MSYMQNCLNFLSLHRSFYFLPYFNFIHSTTLNKIDDKYLPKLAMFFPL